MKVVIATPLYPPEIGGPATYAKILEEGLPAKGIEVELVKFADVRYLPKLARHYAYYSRVLAAARRADLVLALDPVSVGLPAMYAARRAGKPLVVKVAGDYAWEQGRQRFGITQELDEFVRAPQSSRPVRLLQRIETRVARSAARIIVPSAYLKKIVMAWGMPERAIDVIHNAVPLGRVGAVPAEVAALPGPLVVSVGRLVPWKHMDGVIDAVAETSASLALIGNGPLRGALAARAKEKLPGRHAVVGPLSHADTLAVMRSADVFVLNSSYEGLSHVLIEALALGAPIIATAIGGNPEVVADGETGFLVPPDDPTRLADALASLLADAPLRARLGSSAKRRAARFSKDAMLESTAARLTALV